MSIVGPAAAGFWSQQQTTLSELLVRVGNQRAARLLSLVPAAELRDGDPWDPVQVVLRVQSTFLDLFRPADLQAYRPAFVRQRVGDPARLAAVARTGLLDTGPEEVFDRLTRLTRLAATLLGVPYAFVTVADDTRWFWKSCVGIDRTDPALRQNKVEDSFCQYVVATDAELIVNDAPADPRTHDNPLIELMGVRAWAGFPVRARDGQVLGTFCAVDTVARGWTPHDIEVLDTLSQAAAGEIALRIALDEAREATRLAQAATLEALEAGRIIDQYPRQAAAVLPGRVPVAG